MNCAEATCDLQQEAGGRRPSDVWPFTYAPTRRLEQDSYTLVCDNTLETVSKPPVVVGRIDNSSSDNRTEQDLEGGARLFDAGLAEDQSDMEPGGPIGKNRSLIEATPQSYLDARGPVHREIVLGATRQELQGLIDNNMYCEAAGRTEAHLRQIAAHLESDLGWGSSTGEDSTDGNEASSH